MNKSIIKIPNNNNNKNNFEDHCNQMNELINESQEVVNW